MNKNSKQNPDEGVEKSVLENLYEQLNTNSQEPIHIINALSGEQSFVEVIIIDKHTRARVKIDEMMVNGSINAYSDKLFKWTQSLMFPPLPESKSNKLPGIKPFLDEYCSRYELLPVKDDNKLDIIRKKILYRYEKYLQENHLYPGKHEATKIKYLRDNFHATLKSKLAEYIQTKKTNS